MGLLSTIVSTTSHKCSIFRRPFSDDLLAAVGKSICSLVCSVVLSPFLHCRGRHIQWRPMEMKSDDSAPWDGLVCMTSIRQAAGCMDLVQLEDDGRDSSVSQNGGWVDDIHLLMLCSRATREQMCYRLLKKKIENGFNMI